MYSAFISSVYESLQDERSEVIDSLLDYRVFPVCMEHFTASSNKNFGYIKSLIDDSDFLILILGRQYGSCGEDGVSWTEKEYNYAMERGKEVIAIICDELCALLARRNEERLSGAEQKQIAFADRIKFARKVSKTQSISKILGQFFAGLNFDEFAGWTRNSDIMRDEKRLEEWKNNNKAFDLAGQWYHVHLSDDDINYIRTGTITITQKFDPQNYNKLEFEGLNYNLRYDAQNDELCENMLKRSRWNGTYDVDENGVMFGIFHVKREFKGTFNDFEVDKGIRRGIHDFTIAVDKNEAPTFFHGEFHDEAPSPKSGFIYAFRTAEARKEFLKKNFLEVLNSNV